MAHSTCWLSDNLTLQPANNFVVCRPDDDNNAIKDVIGVPQVLKEAKSSQLEHHLQGEHAGEDNVADLQDIGQLFGLGGSTETKNLNENSK